MTRLLVFCEDGNSLSCVLEIVFAHILDKALDYNVRATGSYLDMAQLVHDASADILVIITGDDNGANFSALARENNPRIKIIVIPEAALLEPAMATKLFANAAQLMKKRVLFVDDEPVILSAIARHFRDQEDYHCEFAISAQEALSFWRRSNGGFDLIVTDDRMPGGSGCELIRDFKAMADVPCVLNTGTNPPAGHLADLVVEKPESISRIKEIVDQILAEKGEN